MRGSLSQLKIYARLLRHYLAPQKRQVAFLAIWIFSGIALQLYLPRLLRNFIDLSLAGGDHHRLVLAAILFIAIGLVNQGLAALSTWFSSRIGWRATNVMREDLARHCLDLDMGFHHSRTPGEMIERIDSDVTNLSNFFSKFAVEVLGGFCLLGGVLILLFVEDFRAGILLSFFTLAAGLVLYRFRNIGVAQAELQREANSRLFGFMEEQLAGIEDIRANGGGPYVLDGFYRHNHFFFHQTRKSWMLTFSLYFITMGLFHVGHVLALGMGAWLYFEGSVTLGTVLLFFQYTDLLRMPLQEITRQLQDLQNATAGMRRVDELLAIRSKLPRGRDAALPDGPLGVRFEDVVFGYRDDQQVLDGLTFDLPPGASLGLIGRTGSGKTTIARLLLRLYDPRSGNVKVGGLDVRDAERRSLRHHVGVVTQDVQLFNATLRDNLTFFDRSIPDEKIISVMEQLGLSTWFASFSGGLDRVLPAEGGGISAGEAQLLAFTRIFLRDPGLVILDEPSSRMDPVTQEMVKRAFALLLRNRTAIIIAHRLDTLEQVDRILLLENGRAVEQGRRDKLAANPQSRFARLLALGRGRADLDQQNQTTPEELG